MKSLNIFTRVFISAVIGTVICLAIGAFAFNNVRKNDPEIFQKIDEKYDVGINWENNNDQTKTVGPDGKTTYSVNRGFSFSTGSRRPREEKWSFGSDQKIESLSFNTIKGDIKIKQGTSNEVSVHVEGEVKKRDNTKIVDLTVENGVLKIVETRNIRDLEVTIEIPGPVKKIQMESMAGDLDLKNVTTDELHFSSVSGKLEVENSSIKEFTTKTVSGRVEIESNSEMSGDHSTTSGSTEIKLSSRRPLAFDLRSTTGTIKNTHASDPKAVNKISVNSVTGSIRIE